MYKGGRLGIVYNFPVNYYFSLYDQSGKVITTVKSQKSNKVRITSVKLNIGKGELLILPLAVREIMTDSNYNLLENEEAGKRLGLWLAGKISY